MTKQLSRAKGVSISRRRSALLAGVALAAMSTAGPIVRAATLNWDPGLTNTPTGGGLGTWDLATTSNWYNGAADVAWTDTTATADIASFGGTAGDVVTLINNVGALGLNFTTAGYNITGGNTLSIGASGITSAVAGTISGPVALQANQTWNMSAAFTVSGGISGTGALTKSGGNTLTLTASNNFTGGTTLSAGTVSITNDDNIGGASSAITFNGGNLRITGTTLTNFGTHVVNYSSLNGGIDINASANTFTISQAISGTGTINKLGNGALVLSGNNSYNGGTTLTAGALGITSDANIGGASSTINFNGGSLRVIGSGVTGLGTHVVNLSTFNGGIDVASGYNTFVMNQAISGSGSLSKSGVGVLNLAVANSHSGTTTLANGRLNISDVGALGSGTFAITGTGTSYNSGAQFEPTGFLDNTTGGSATLSTNNPINLITGNSNTGFTFIGTNDLDLGTGAVTIANQRIISVLANTLTIGGAMGESTAGSGILKQGAGTLVLSNAASNFTGPTTINAGTLNLGTTGQLYNAVTPGNLVLVGGELAMTGTAGGPRTQSFGQLSLTPSGNNIPARGTITLTADPAQPTSVTFASLIDRRKGAMTLFRGSNLGSTPGNGVASIFFAVPPPVTVGTTDGNFYASTGTGTGTQQAVFRGALIATTPGGTGNALATYDATNGVRPLNAGSEQIGVTTGAAFTATGIGDNVRLDGGSITGTSVSITGKQVNTLQLTNTGTGAVTVTHSGTMNPTNGMLFTGNQGITFSGGTISSTGSDTIILSTNTAGVTIASAINNANGPGQHSVTFGGPGNIQVNATVTASSSGGFFFDGPGTVTLNASQSVTSQGLTVAGGGVKFGSSFTMGSARPWKVGTGASIDTNGVSVANVDFLTDVNGQGGLLTNTGATPSTITITNGSTTNQTSIFTGVITNGAQPLNLVLNGNTAATQVLAGANSYTGSTTVGGSTLRIGVTNTLPITTPLSVNGGTFDLFGNHQTVGSLAGTAGGTIVTSVAGSLSTLTINGGSTTSFGGVIADNGGTGGVVSLVKSGTGTQSLGGVNTYTGNTTVNAGILRVNGSLANTAVTVNSSGTIGGSGSIAGPVTVNSGGAIAPGASVGTLTLSTLNLTAGTQTLNYEVGSSAGVGDLTNVTTANGLTVSGAAGSKTINIASDGSGPVASGDYTLIDYAGTPLSGISQFTLGSLPIRVTAPGGLVHDAGNTLIKVTLVADAPKWVGNNGNAWDINTTTNWKEITSGNATKYLQPGAVGDFVTFDDSAPNPNVNITTAVAPAGLLVNNDNLSYSFSGTGKITGAVGLTKQGTGTLTIGNTTTNDYTGATNINAGTVIVTGTLSGTSGINVASGAALQVGNGGTTGSIAATPIANGGAVSVNLSASGTTTFAGAMTGAGTLNQTGGGTLVLSGNNSGYTGNISSTGSALRLANANALVNSNLSLTNATLSATTSLAVGSTATAIVLAGGTIIDPGTSNITLSGKIQGTGAALSRSSGTGQLVFGATGNNDSNFNVWSGTFTNSSGPVTFSSRAGGGLNANFVLTAPEAVTVGGLGGILHFGSLSGTSPITGGSARVNIGNAGVSTSYSGTITGTFGLRKIGTASLTILSPGNQFSFDAQTGVVGYPVAASSGKLIAGVSSNATSGALGADGTNLLLGQNATGVAGDLMNDVALLTGGAVKVGNNILVSGGATVSTQVEPYTLSIGGNTDNNSTFAGAITLQNNLTVTQVGTTGGNALRITGDIAGTAVNNGPSGSTQENTGSQTVTFTGPGAIVASGAIGDGGTGGVVQIAATGGNSTLSGVLSYTGSTSVSGGALHIQGNLTSSSAVVVSGGTLELASDGSHTRMIRTASVSVSGSGKLDLQDNKLIATATPVGSWNGTAYTDVSGMIAAGRNGSAVPLWDGNGIVTSQTTATAGNYHSIGVAKGVEVKSNAATETALWGGQTITGTDTLVMFTYGGDANLDGKLNIDDYVKIDTGIASGLTGWANGDFNYDGKINIDDYTTVIDANIGIQSGVFPTSGGIGGGVSGVSAVPEPGSLGVISLTLACLAPRRRRRRAVSAGAAK